MPTKSSLYGSQTSETVRTLFKQARKEHTNNDEESNLLPSGPASPFRHFHDFVLWKVLRTTTTHSLSECSCLNFPVGAAICRTLPLNSVTGKTIVADTRNK